MRTNLVQFRPKQSSSWRIAGNGLRTITLAALFFAPFVGACGASDKPASETPKTSQTDQRDEQWNLVWQDEFNGSDGSALDESKWTIETGGHGWGNNELQYYTARPSNIRIEGGNLVITAIKEDFTGPDQVSRSYTSARIKTQGKFTQKYGRFDARIKIPQGAGMWPAFWMLGDNISEVRWPTCGEIDIMENIGVEPDKVHGSLHGPGYSGENPLTGTYQSKGGVPFHQDFHVFSVEWEPGTIRFYVDGKLYQTRTSNEVPAGTRWVYDHPFFLLVNLAVGGNWPGSPNASTVFPQSMQVDYVRVFTRR